MEFKNKTIIVTGANGLVGVPAVRKCLEEGAAKVIAVDIKLGNQLTELKEHLLSKYTKYHWMRT